MGTVLSFGDAQDQRRKQARLVSPRPYCGPCLDEFDEINDLLPITLWDAHGDPVLGHYCPACGEEFTD